MHTYTERRTQLQMNCSQDEKESSDNEADENVMNVIQFIKL